MKNKLLNPFVLIGQGFLAGAALFYTTAAEQATPQPLPERVEAVAVEQIAGI